MLYLTLKLLVIKKPTEEKYLKYEQSFYKLLFTTVKRQFGTQIYRLTKGGFKCMNMPQMNVPHVAVGLSFVL